MNKNFIEPAEKINTTLIKVKDPYSSFTTILELFNKEITSKKGISEFTVIEKNAIISDSSYIGSFTTIGKDSKISELSKDDRKFVLLEEIGAEPNVFYQLKVRNNKEA